VIDVTAVWIIARLTLREAMRRRMLLALFGLSGVAVALTAWGYAQLQNVPGVREGNVAVDEVQLVASQLLIGVTFMFSFVLALFAVLAAAPAIAGARESGELQAIAARPVPRSSILLGKWLALALVVVAYAAASGIAELVVVALITGYVPVQPVEAILYVAAEGLVVLTLTFLLGTRLSAVTSGVVAMLLFGIAWLSGVVGGIGLAFGDQAMSWVAPLVSFILPSDGLWRGAIYSLEPASVVLAGAQAGPQIAAFPFFADSPPAPAFVAWSFAWVVIVLVGAVIGFARNDL
jgi:ABC-type transport system involved in multi-copper enzyme maturation permease subunit